MGILTKKRLGVKYLKKQWQNVRFKDTKKDKESYFQDIS